MPSTVLGESCSTDSISNFCKVTRKPRGETRRPTPHGHLKGRSFPLLPVRCALLHHSRAVKGLAVPVRYLLPLVMRSLHFSHLLLAAASVVSATPLTEQNGLSKRTTPIAPKVFIIDMFEPEGAVWWGIPEFDVLAQNITIPGLSPLFPEVHCTSNGDVCQVITGESEINAASSISALVLSSQFDLTKTYFFVAGIAGVNPEVATLASVTL